ncbi:MAG: DUF995 domain-containing protein [Burkholderiaceae bacterium]|jgi:hypothetical protein|nr:DUF995 domain-containing protein [Burkholderiaceae bacterium]
MRKIIWLLLPAVASFAAVADEAGTRLSGEELKALVTGATVAHVSKSGNPRRWKNAPDGALMATSDRLRSGRLMGQQAASSPGTWSINDEGKYCVRIDWRTREEEKWCAYIVRAADGGHYLNSVEPGREIEFSK